MYIEVRFRSASADGLRKFIEAVQCPIEGVAPSFDSHYSEEGDSHLLRYMTWCRELNGLLKQKISSLHAQVQYQEGTPGEGA